MEGEAGRGSRRGLSGALLNSSLQIVPDYRIQAALFWQFQ
jgi:hypothetical protein